ncbi:MAG: adenylate/guanylate cyclase domain-containing protein [Alphaproteobacteria bacterium]|jgi:class 3 adenylate cyclase|nr:adenylate/guanylate cyclase domain-containing protein [Alphaproteobacteria bacterium]
MADVRKRLFEWEFDSPVEKVWPVLADTARFNEAAGLPKHDIIETPRADGSVEYLGRTKMGPTELEWEDHPVNWVYGRWFEHRRTFRKGPLTSLVAHLAFTPSPTGCRGEYSLQAEAANLIGRTLLATGFFASAERDFGRLAADAREFAAGRSDREFEVPTPELSAGAQGRVSALVAEIEATSYGNGLAQWIADYVVGRQEVDVVSIRPLKLARLWGIPERETIEACLQAAKAGLLGMRWDLLCPRCQVGKQSTLALDQLPTGAHCPSCNIDYGQNFSENLELAFHPSRSIRLVDGREYCLFGPMSTPHVKVQLTVEPGESRSEAIDLTPGTYRLRTLEPGDEVSVQFETGGFPEVIAEGDRLGAGEPGEPGAVTFHNRSARRLTFMIEELGWRRDALTAHRVTTLQAFRDLFDEQLLRPGDDVDIDHVTIMFTDLKGSTALYEAIGDSQAYHLVREHFAVLGKAVRENNGSIVKTIGDAIMASFADPLDGLKCGIQIHRDFEIFNANSGRVPVTIKLGLHVGRCISVTLNNRLDYYGSAANKAARLEGQSLGGDIVFSEEFARDPAVVPLVAELKAECDETALKGFEEPVPFYRVSQDTLLAWRR